MSCGAELSITAVGLADHLYKLDGGENTGGGGGQFFNFLIWNPYFDGHTGGRQNWRFWCKMSYSEVLSVHDLLQHLASAGEITKQGEMSV